MKKLLITVFMLIAFASYGQKGYKSVGTTYGKRNYYYLDTIICYFPVSKGFPGKPGYYGIFCDTSVKPTLWYFYNSTDSTWYEATLCDTTKLSIK